MLESNYKRLAYVGILLWIGIAVCEAALLTDDSGIHLELGVAPNIIIAAIFSLILVFFLLPLFYIKSYSRRLFISILVIGALTIAFPANDAWETVTRWLAPKENTFFSNLSLFKVSAFRAKVNNIENAILLGIFICQLTILILTFIIRKLNATKNPANNKKVG